MTRRSPESQSSYHPYEPIRGEISISPEWFKRPPLVMSRRYQVVSENAIDVVPELSELVESLYHQIADEFSRHGSAAWYWDEGEIHHPSPHMVILQPVFLGRLPEAVQQALHHGDVHGLAHQLRQHLPEHEPLAAEIGKREMGLGRIIHPNFTTMIFVDDTSGDIRALPYERKITLLRTFFAKHGSFKSIIVPYLRQREGLTVDRVILATLEGGHPELGIAELAKRLMIFGSLTEVGGSESSPDSAIPREWWERSKAVGGLIEVGRFLGARGLLSAPVEIAEVVRNPRLARKIIKLIHYSRQAEGAFMAFAHDLPASTELPWEGVPVVTASGRFETIKDDLSYEDLVAVIPMVKRGSGQLTVATIAVDGWMVKGPSVEAEEFTHPLLSLSKEDPRYLLYLTRADGGFVVGATGRLAVPPLRGVVHLHRGFISPRSERVKVVDADLSRFPPVGCGVDRMFEMSHDAMRRAFHLWERGGRRAAVIAFPLPNHGTNVFIPWTAGADGIIPQDPFALFKGVVERQELQFTAEVPQV